VSSFCENVKELHSSSIKGGEFLEQQVLSKISASWTKYCFEFLMLRSL
jgi:hypothetical protein